MGRTNGDCMDRVANPVDMPPDYYCICVVVEKVAKVFQFLSAFIVVTL